jgi:hypothetical protein
MWKNGDGPILTVLGQKFHWEFARLRKTPRETFKELMLDG